MSDQKLDEAYDELSNGAIDALHYGIVKAYTSDRQMSTAQKEAAACFGSSLTYHGVDEFTDWRQHGQALERVMKKRGMKFNPVKY